MMSTRASRLMILHCSLVLASSGCNNANGTEKSNLNAGAGGDAASGAGGQYVFPATGGVPDTGGSSASIADPTGGNQATGGQTATGGSKATGGTIATGGSVATGGVAATFTPYTITGSTGSGNCTFDVTVGVSSTMPTVGTVDWSTSSSVVAAEIVYTLDGPPAGTINKGGSAPVDLTKANYHTLLLGLKQSSAYSARIDALLADGSICTSADFGLTTGALSGAPSIARTVNNASAQATGFIVTSSGLGGTTYSGGAGGTGQAFIVDADGAVVWTAAAPTQCSRALMDYEGANMWMVSLNVQNSGGEMRFVSMDGKTTRTQISGLSGAHHDFTVLPHKVAAMVWASPGIDTESTLVEMASDGSGSATPIFTIGSNLYAGGYSANGAAGPNTYHCNAIHYWASDESFTIADRNPNASVKVSHSGAIQWQVGGSCTNAPAGAANCVPESWVINHGHHLLQDGAFLMFVNGSSGPSHVFEYALGTSGAVTATQLVDFTSGSNSSSVFGDVQRLPNGNTLITYSTAGVLLEVDPTWNTVQTIKATSLGYADWRETLYGPPSR
jgi:hypothetical protein